MIHLDGVTKLYGDTVAVDDLTLDVAEGEVCVLIGPSGCGKTTTLRMINRLITPTSGRIIINGQDASELKAEELRRSLGYAIQSVGLFPHLDVAANIAVVPRLLGWDKQRMLNRAHELLELVGLDPLQYMSKYPRQLSGGEAQRIGVARALAADPPVLLMDEPFGAVDPLNRERLQGEFARIQRDLHKTVVFVTHDIDEAIRLADKIAIMRDGRLVQYDTPETILDNPVNHFVRDFVGSDRALKRLVRVPVRDVMDTHPPVARRAASAQEMLAEAGRTRFVYLVDEQGRLTGWLDRAQLKGGRTVEDALSDADPDQVAVALDASLKEALSRMLGLGFRSIAVVEPDGRLVGQVTLGLVEGAMTESDEHQGAHPADQIAQEICDDSGIGPTVGADSGDCT